MGSGSANGQQIDTTDDCERLMNVFMTICVLKAKSGGGSAADPSGSGSLNAHCRQVEDAWIERCVDVSKPKTLFSGSGVGSALSYLGPPKPWKDEDDGMPGGDQSWSQVFSPLGAGEDGFAISEDKAGMESVKT